MLIIDDTTTAIKMIGTITLLPTDFTRFTTAVTTDFPAFAIAVAVLFLALAHAARNPFCLTKFMALYVPFAAFTPPLTDVFTTRPVVRPATMLVLMP